MARVVFRSRLDTAYGENLVLVGSAVELGSWRIDDGVRMQYDDGTWWCECCLPCGAAVDFKIVKTDGRAREEWIGGDGHASISSKDRGNMTVNVRLGREGAEPTRLLNGVSSEQIDVMDVDLVDAHHAGHGTASTSLAPMHPNTYSNNDNNGAIDFAAAAAKAGMPMTVTHTTTTTVTIGDASATSTDGQPTFSGGNAIESPQVRDEEKDPKSDAALAEATFMNDDLSKFYRSRIRWRFPAHSVSIKGAWDGWAREIALLPRGSRTSFEIELVLPADEFTSESLEMEFKFIVDGVWKCDDSLPVSNGNNVIIVSRRDMVYAFPSMRRLPQASSPAHVEPGASVTTIDV